MNRLHYLHKIMVCMVMTVFSTMHGAGNEQPITIAYDAAKIEATKKDLPQHWPTLKNVGNFLHETSMHACPEQAFICFQMIYKLIQENPDCVNIPDGGQDLPLSVAVRFNLEPFAALLIACGAKIPEDQNDPKHPLKQGEGPSNNTYKLVQAYTEAQDKAAFSKQIQQRLQIPGITLFEETTTSQSQNQPHHQGQQTPTSTLPKKDTITQAQTPPHLANNAISTQDKGGKATGQSSTNQSAKNPYLLPVVLGITACALAGTVYALYTNRKNLFNSNSNEPQA